MDTLLADARFVAFKSRFMGQLPTSPHTLIVLTTNKCSAECAHCCMNSSTTRSGQFDLQLFEQTVLQLKSLGTLRIVVFAGGEPTLTKNSLFEALRIARSHGLATRMVTNASWAIDETRTCTMLSKLRDAGLNELNISFDDYHLPYIPEKNVVNAWRHARKMDFSAVMIANACHEGSKVTPEYIETLLGEKLPRRFDDETGENLITAVKDRTQYYGVSNCSLMYIGRGQDLRKSMPRKSSSNNGSLFQHCPNLLRSPAITPENHLVGCCGFEMKENPVLNFGSLAESKPGSLWSGALDDILVRAISQLGPGFLLRYAASLDPSIAIKDHYQGICEVCQDVTTDPKVMEILDANLEEIANILYNVQMSGDQHAQEA